MTTITTPQLNYLADLATVIYANDAAKLFAQVTALGGLTKEDAKLKLNRWIPIAKAIKANAPKVAPVANVVEGWYLAGGQEVKVKISKKGFPYCTTKAGAYIAGASPEGKALLAEIEANPKGCSISFGKATGKCGVCHTKLTNPVSIAAGIGPICAKSF